MTASDRRCKFAKLGQTSQHCHAIEGDFDLAFRSSKADSASNPHVVRALVIVTKLKLVEAALAYLLREYRVALRATLRGINVLKSARGSSCKHVAARPARQ